jgi:hypothetical protein
MRCGEVIAISILRAISGQEAIMIDSVPDAAMKLLLPITIDASEQPDIVNRLTISHVECFSPAPRIPTQSIDSFHDPRQRVEHQILPPLRLSKQKQKHVMSSQLNLITSQPPPFPSPLVPAAILGPNVGAIKKVDVKLKQRHLMVSVSSEITRMEFCMVSQDREC